MAFKNWKLCGINANEWMTVVAAATGHEVCLLDIHAINKGIETTRVKFALFSATPPTELPAPTGLSVIPQGTTGSTTYSYKITALNARGESLASTLESISNGNATLTGSNYNQLSWPGVSGATKYRVYGKSASNLVLLAETATTTWNDQGATAIAGATTTPIVNSTAIAANVFEFDLYPKYLNDPVYPFYLSVQKKLFLAAGEVLMVASNKTDIDVVVSGEDSTL